MRLKSKREEMLEMSVEQEDGFFDDENFEKDENTRIRAALEWKRKHFFV